MAQARPTQPSRKSPTGQQLTGMAAVHYVATELSQRSYTVAMTSRNARGVDLLAMTPSGQTISLQVKANKPRQLGGTHGFWIMGKHDAMPLAMFYVFVNLNPVGQRADFYIVPGAYVAEHLVREGEWYFFYRKRASAEQFKDAWDLLANRGHGTGGNLEENQSRNAHISKCSCAGRTPVKKCRISRQLRVGNVCRGCI